MADEAQEIEGLFISATADKPRALAEVFCSLFADEQSAFFDHVATLSADWTHPAYLQWRNMEASITPKARDLLKEMHDHTGA